MVIVIVAATLVLSVVLLGLQLWTHGVRRAEAVTARRQREELLRALDCQRETHSAQIASVQKALVEAFATKSRLDARAQHEKAADMGIALAERMARLHPVGPRGEKVLTSFDKAKMAVDWAVAYCSDVEAPIAPAEMRKIVEIRLEQTQPKKKR